MDLENVHEKKEGSNPFVVCDNYLNDPQNVYMVSKGWKEKFLKTLKSMSDCIDALVKNKDMSDYDYSEIEQCLNYLTNLTVEKQEFKPLTLFIDEYISIAHNVNENTIKNDTIRKKISYLKRYADRSLTMAEAMSLMRRCSLRLGRFKDLELPPYRLSQHYYTTIKEG